MWSRIRGQADRSVARHSNDKVVRPADQSNASSAGGGGLSTRCHVFVQFLSAKAPTRGNRGWDAGCGSVLKFWEGLPMRQTGGSRTTARGREMMTVSAISAASLSQSVLASSDSNQLQQALQSLQSSITSGDLNGAQSAFEVLQTLNQGLATASGNSGSSNSQISASSQISSDLTALGSALSSGNLSTAQSAFTTVKNDLNNSGSPSLANETDAASQAVQTVGELLSTLNVNSSSASISDSTTSVLERVYGTSGGLNVQA
jgi:hypothetical protein